MFLDETFQHIWKEISSFPHRNWTIAHNFITGMSEMCDEQREVFTASVLIWANSFLMSLHSMFTGSTRTLHSSEPDLLWEAPSASIWEAQWFVVSSHKYTMFWNVHTALSSSHFSITQDDKTLKSKIFEDILKTS